ncbi:MAG: dioxygenase [Deltaproteobacteria bacterium]|nr:dioxygenase [Deltaproteobacteria bacterium]
MDSKTPFHLRGNYAPVKEELTVFDLEVEGHLPNELNGSYLRNGANPMSGKSDHWFLGDGMVHGIRIEKGKPVWYRNRYVQTPRLTNPGGERISSLGEIDRTISAANTHIVKHGGKILALEEGSFPYELDPELATIGPVDYDGKLTSAFSAHPHVCPKTGEMLSFGYGQLPPYLTYLRISPSGELLQSEEIEVPGPTMMHDFMITEKHAIFMDLPVIFDLETALKGLMPFKWSDDYGARIGIMPREGSNADIRWFEVEPCFVFHGLNAWEEGSRLSYDVCRSSEIWREAGDMQGGEGELTLHRFTFDLETGGVSEQTLDERPMEFPRIADDRVGLKNRYGYTLGVGSSSDKHPAFLGHYKIDMEKGSVEARPAQEGCVAGEAVFIPAEGAAPNSDEGYLMTYVYDNGTSQSELVVMDASRFESPPIARIKMPQRVPFGFHGSWIPETN